jgi:hypothetical protein
MRKKKRDIVQRFFFAFGCDSVFEIERDDVGIEIVDAIEMFELQRIEHHIGAMPPVRAGCFSGVAVMSG